jgi:molecular chaperone DnaK (HSP70)
VAKGAAIYALNSAYTKTVDNYNKGLIDERPLPLKGPRARVVNVTSKTYGTRLYNKEGKLVVYNMIFANTPLPVEVIEPASTRVDNQKFLAITVYESDFTDPVADYQVEERFCVKLEERNLELNKNWPKGTPCDVKFSLNEEGILAVHCEVDKDKIDFELTITGVKTQEEMEKSTIAIGKTVVS